MEGSAGRGKAWGKSLGEEQKPEPLAARSPLYPTISPSCSHCLAAKAGEEEALAAKKYLDFF